MRSLVEEISLVNAEELEDLLRAVLKRYAVLFPDWEISTVSFQRGKDRNADIDRFIEVLTQMKDPAADRVQPG